MQDTRFDLSQEMAAGGLHDQLDGGFHRYSVDQFWHMPHFEKMLYVQAQLPVAKVVVSAHEAFAAPQTQARTPQTSNS